MPRHSLLYAFTALALVVTPLSAQQPAQQAKPDSVAAGQDTPALIVQAQADGTTSGATVGTTGWVASGFVSGLVLGLVGTGITWALAGYSDPKLPRTKQLLIANEPVTYRLVYEKSFTDKVKTKRKSSALTGGLLGTGTLLILFIASH